MLALIPGQDGGRPDLAVSGGRYVASGYDLQTAAQLQLYCEAPARPGDQVPEGRSRHGWWGQAFLPEGEIFGSRWWILEGRQAVPDTLRLGEEILREAFDPWVDRGWASKIEVPEARFASRDGTTWLLAGVRIFAPDGALETFSAWQELVS